MEILHRHQNRLGYKPGRNLPSHLGLDDFGFCFALAEAYLRQPVEPFRQILVGFADEFHGSRDEHRTYQGRIHQYSYPQAEAHLLEHYHVAQGEAAEDSYHNEGGTGNQLAG